MSRENHATEAVADSAMFYIDININEKSAIWGFFAGIFAVFFEFFTFIKTKTIHAFVNFGTFLHSRALVPLALYGIGIWALAAKLISNASCYIRCLSHTVSVSMAGIRRNRIALVTMLFSIAVFIVASSAYSVGIKITLDGKEIGYMHSREEYDEAIRFVETRASEILEHPYSVTGNVRFEIGVIPREKIISKEEIGEIFFERIEEVSELYALTVDGQVVGASTNEETLQEMVDQLLYVNDPAVKANFTQDVQIVRQYVDASYLISYDEIRKKLSSKIHSTLEYTVEYGDTIDKIAKKNGMTTEALLELNPSLSNSRLRAGKKVVVGKELPFLSVEAVRRVEYTETIPFETTKIESADLYKGSTKISVKGKTGTRNVVADVTYIDNKEVSRNILSSTVTAQPVTQVVYVGTKARPKTMATGKLSRPVSGAVISSNYGMRRGRMHKGVDFAARTGTRISAADGGTVTWAGWKSGGWGYLVVINHGNGLETFYAHNSKVTVRVGQKVAKGEQIAKMGSTGNSSGPHCHFEIHVNGKYVSPWKYIS